MFQCLTRLLSCCFLNRFCCERRELKSQNTKTTECFNISESELFPGIQQGGSDPGYKRQDLFSVPAG